MNSKNCLRHFSYISRLSMSRRLKWFQRRLHKITIQETWCSTTERERPHHQPVVTFPAVESTTSFSHTHCIKHRGNVDDLHFPCQGSVAYLGILGEELTGGQSYSLEQKSLKRLSITQERNHQWICKGSLWTHSGIFDCVCGGLRTGKPQYFLWREPTLSGSKTHLYRRHARKHTMFKLCHFSASVTRVKQWLRP